MDDLHAIILEVPALHCDGCISSVAQVLAGFPGVLSIEGDLERRELTVEYDPTSVTPVAMSAQLAEIGYPVAETRQP